jgi:DNA (cytosine-5)-methyltransferase 1
MKNSQMSITEITRGDQIADNQIYNDVKPTHELLKLLITIYDQKNLAIKLTNLGYKIDREKLNKWRKNPLENKLSIDIHSRVHIERKLLPAKPAHYGNPDFTFIDLFAGIGGIRKGFDDLKGECVFTSEWDEKARRTYLANHYVGKNELDYFLDSEEDNSERNTRFMDITQITQSADDTKTKSEKEDHIRKHIPEHDVLLAGFPCQPFSLAGVSKKNSLGRSHGFDCDTQGTLFFDVEQIIAARQPKFFVLENVKNLKSHDKGNTFAVIIKALDNLGYWLSDITDNGQTIEEAIEQVRKRKNDPTIIDAVNYTPQHRERIVLVGIRKDIGHSGFTLNNIETPNHKPTVADILLPEVDSKYTLTTNLWNYLFNYALKHQIKGNGFGFGLVDPEKKSATTRTLSARYYKDGSEILINYQGLEPEYLTKALPSCLKKVMHRHEYVGDLIKNFKNDNEGCSAEELKMYTKDVELEFNKLYGRYPAKNFFDPAYKTPRRLTPQECARLMGFEKPNKFRSEDDSDFNIVCADTSAYRQFGNSVVVPVFKAVGALMIRYIKKC